MKNEQDIIVGNKRGLETKIEQNITLSLVGLSFLFLCFLSSKNICSFLFCTSNDIKNVQFGVEMRENLKVFSDKIPFIVYLNYSSIVT
jgi:hypothetical protein